MVSNCDGAWPRVLALVALRCLEGCWVANWLLDCLFES